MATSAPDVPDGKVLVPVAGIKDQCERDADLSTCVPLFLLAPPRSFTSIVCAMLGQHPEMYGVPEVNLFVAETMREREAILRPNPWGTHGLLRAVAQLSAGEQTVQTVRQAGSWVASQRDRKCVSVFRDLADAVAPRIVVDKSPRTVLDPQSLYRAGKAFQQARFLHLTRHPRSFGRSLWNMGGVRAAAFLGAIDWGTDVPTPDVQKAWHSLHVNIVTFLATVPDDQKLRYRGEDVLADPRSHLCRIADWLGLGTDNDAVAKMLHPEQSPYAGLGPPNARFGNDPKFLFDPIFQPSRSHEESLEGPLEWREDEEGFSDETRELAYELGYR